jgi:cobalt/nickel transport system ATP-binding protein
MPFDVAGLALQLGGRTILEDVSFSVRPGERVVLLGVNGCGKTTLLKALDGLVGPSAGTIRYGGALVTPAALDQAAFRRRFLDRPPFELSGGEKKRVALAALLAIGPKVLLLDEATANLDPASSARLVDFLAVLDDVTVIVSTHNLSIAEELGARAILLAPGRSGVCFDGPTAELAGDERLLVETGLAHRHGHRHGATEHAHYHVHDSE